MIKHKFHVRSCSLEQTDVFMHQLFLQSIQPLDYTVKLKTCIKPQSWFKNIKHVKNLSNLTTAERLMKGLMVFSLNCQRAKRFWISEMFFYVAEKSIEFEIFQNVQYNSWNDHKSKKKLKKWIDHRKLSLKEIKNTRREIIGVLMTTWSKHLKTETCHFICLNN